MTGIQGNLINECKSIIKQGLNWFSNVNDFIKEYIKQFVGSITNNFTIDSDGLSILNDNVFFEQNNLYNNVKVEAFKPES